MVVQIHTDGSAQGGVGDGAFAVAMRVNGTLYTYQSKCYNDVTNNQMELSAVIMALRMVVKNVDAVGKGPVTVYSDSQYVVNQINGGWVYVWKKNNYNKGSKKEIKNIPLWEEFVALYEKTKELNVDVNFEWVKGHAGVSDNELCDTLAVEARLNRYDKSHTNQKKEEV